MFNAVKTSLVNFLTSSDKLSNRKRTRANSISLSPPDKRRKSFNDESDEEVVVDVLPVSYWNLKNIFDYVTGRKKSQMEKKKSRSKKLSRESQVVFPPRFQKRRPLSQISNHATEVFDLTCADSDEVEIIDDDNDLEVTKDFVDLSDIECPRSKAVGYVNRKHSQSTLDQSIRLDEKKRYKEILSKFTSAVNPFTSCKPEVTKISDKNCEPAKQQCVQIDLTKDDRVFIKPKKKLFSEILSNTSLLDISLLSNNKSIRKSPSDGSKTIPSSSSLLDSNWIEKWRKTLEPANLDRERQIKEAELKAAALEKTKQEEFERLQKEVKKDVLHKLTNDMLSLVIKIASSGNPREVISQGFNAEITRADLWTLRDACWLNDEVINFYFYLLKERSEKNKNLPKIHVFNTFFYPKITKSGFAGVKRWTRKIDIFSFDMVLIPIHLGMHWCMAEVNFKNKQIIYYDSLKGDNRNCILALKDYVKQESADKKKLDFDFSDWFELMPKEIPEQMNGCDCGVFASIYADYRSRNSEFNFSQKDMQYFRKRMIYEIATKSLL